MLICVGSSELFKGESRFVIVCGLILHKRLLFMHEQTL